jgi:hypothetical protein
MQSSGPVWASCQRHGEGQHHLEAYLHPRETPSNTPRRFGANVSSKPPRSMQSAVFFDDALGGF